MGQNNSFEKSVKREAAVENSANIPQELINRPCGKISRRVIDNSANYRSLLNFEKNLWDSIKSKGILPHDLNIYYKNIFHRIKSLTELQLNILVNVKLLRRNFQGSTGPKKNMKYYKGRN